MIKARRLFLVPALASFLCLTIWLVPVFVIICLIWYTRNQEDIHSYFRGQNYRMNEISKVEIEKDKFL